MVLLLTTIMDDTVDANELDRLNVIVTASRNSHSEEDDTTTYFS